MSLILEALKKLDREKQAPDRGVVVLGASAWAARSEGRSRLWLFLLAALLLVGLGAGLVFFWLGPSATAPAPPGAWPRAATPASAGTPELTLTPFTPPSPAAPPAPRSSRPSVLAAPVRPASPSPEAPRPVFVLQAVSEQDGQPVALISDRLLHVGEGFDGMRVVSITPTEVELEIEATRERRTLTF